MGVDVRTDTKVEDIDEEDVVASGTRIASRTIIWSAGVKATPVADWLGTEADKKGLVKVRPDLSLAGRAEVFVIGDAALALDEEGRPLPGLAAVAKQQGAYVARGILDRIEGREPSSPFCYRDWEPWRPWARPRRWPISAAFACAGLSHGLSGSWCTSGISSASAIAFACCSTGYGSTPRSRQARASSPAISNGRS